MKLEKFKKYGKRNKKIIISVIGIVLIICGVLLFKSFAFFESQYNFDVIKGRIPPFNVGDVTLALTIDGVKTGTIPTKGSYDVNVSCDNEAVGAWNYDNWSLNVSNLIKNKVKCSLDFVTVYRETMLNGSYPVLGEEMIPITIGNNGVVTYADTKTEWYSYEKKNWANAVILTEEGKNKNYTIGNTISEEDIESYFVWIPKYAYKIQTLGQNSQEQEKPFEIRFGTTNTVDNTTECIAPNVSGQSGQCAVGKYMTPSAFTTLGDIKGLWVGKFETTGIIDAITVKPNVTSLKNQNVSSFFKAGYNYRRNLDSHMMKNTEWGAMVYLTNSIYGKCNSTTKICEEVYINNNSNYITGWSATSVSEEPSSSSGYAYTNSNSVKATTTGNYSGIYDVSGGTQEYMAAVLGDLTSGKSGFSAIEAEAYNLKYYDRYITESIMLGDAIVDNMKWFGDWVCLAKVYGLWLIRGGTVTDTIYAGIFYLHTYEGEALDKVSFRLVLAPL